jgi:protein TonB
MNASLSEDKINKIVGLLLVLGLHGALLYVAMSYKLIPPPQEAVTLFVSMINPPPKKEEPPPPEPPKPPPKKVELVKQKPITPPQPAPILVAEAPVTSPIEPIAPPPPPQPIIETPPAPVIEESIKPAQPVVMSSELSLACPNRSPPNYPAISRRLGEQGQVKLKVELDETGRVTSARVVESSGYKRLDDAGLAAVKSWRCNPATRDGKPVRAIALQPLDFILN